MEFSHPKNLEKPICSVLLAYVEGVWEVEMHQELIQIQDSIYNKTYPQEFIMKTKPQGDTQHMVHCVCSIQLECGRNYVGESGRPLVVWLGEHSIWDGDIWKNPNWFGMPMKATS
jgi:hypothetical protein